MTDKQTTGAGGPGSTSPKSAAEIASSLRLRPERPPVTRLSRKVLAGGTALALVLVSGAVLWALQQQSHAWSSFRRAVQHRSPQCGRRPCRAAARLCGHSARRAAPRAAIAGRSRSSHCCGPGPVRTACGRSRATADEPGKRGRAHQQGICVNECSATGGSDSCRDDLKCRITVR